MSKKIDVKILPPTCPGTMIWFDASDPRLSHSNAILECSADGCDYIIVSGNYHREDHAFAPVLREGFGG